MSTSIRTRRARSGAVAIAAAGLLLGVAGPARADSHAACSIDDHMQVSRSGQAGPGPLIMRPSGGSTHCAGTLADALVRDGGFAGITLRLTRVMTQDGGCVLRAGSASLSAAIPRALAILADPEVTVGAALSAQQAGSALYLDGPGTAAGQPIAVTGVAHFLPGAGQSCLTGVSSGELVSHIVVTTGSASSAAPQSDGAGSGQRDTGQVRSARASHSRHSHHRRHGRRHRGRRH